MRIQQGPVQTFENLQFKKKTGHWYNWKRVFVIQVDDAFAVVSLNAWERMFKNKTLNKNFPNKHVTILTYDQLKNLKRKQAFFASSEGTSIQPELQNKDESKEISRVIYHALYKTNILPIDTLANYGNQVLEYIQTYQELASLDNPSPLDHIAIKSSDVHIDDNDLQVTLRYLVLTDQLLGYQNTSVSYRVFLNASAFPKDNRRLFCTKERLLYADQKLQNYHLSSLPIAPKDLKEKAEIVFQELEKNLWLRWMHLPAKALVVYKVTVEDFYHAKDKTNSFASFLDQLTLQGFIHSWNLKSLDYTLYIKIFEVDDASSYKSLMWQKWRDAKTIQQV